MKICSSMKNHIPRGQRQRGIGFLRDEQIFISPKPSCNELFNMQNQQDFNMHFFGGEGEVNNDN
jgi:hypothetical protein